MTDEDNLRDALHQVPDYRPHPIDVGAVLRRSRRRRLPGQVALGATVGLAVAALGLSGIQALQPFGAPNGSGSSIVSGATEDAAEGGSADDSAAGTGPGETSMLAPADKLNLCGGPLTPLAQSGTGLHLTVAFPDAAAGINTVPGIVTLTNTGDGSVRGTTSAVPSITVSKNGIVFWHSNGPPREAVVDVSLAPGESQSYPASFAPVRCSAEDDLAPEFRPDLPSLPPGDYQVSAAMYLTAPDGVIELVTGPPASVQLN